jgi:CubicO group peptidase (beta-lactamase class C family)
VISEASIEAATSVQVSAETPLGGPIVDRYGKKFPFDGRGVYGFNWWVNGVQPSGERLWPGIPADAFGAIGFNNNRLFVIPEWDMVVVRLGQDGRERRIKREEFVELLQGIGEAIED